MSKDKLRILIKILAESHMAFDLGDKIDIIKLTSTVFLRHPEPNYENEVGEGNWLGSLKHIVVEPPNNRNIKKKGNYTPLLTPDRWPE